MMEFRTVGHVSIGGRGGAWHGALGRSGGGNEDRVVMSGADSDWNLKLNCCGVVWKVSEN